MAWTVHSRPSSEADCWRIVVVGGNCAMVGRRLILVLILVLWELVPRTGLLAELFLPSLSKTLTVLVQNWDEYAHALMVTLYEVALAMLIACGGGILIGALVGGLAILRNLLLPVFSSLYAVPIVILYPIFTAWFGIGSESKIAFAGIYGFFPVMLSTAAGIRTIDQQLLLAARSMGATRSAADHARDHPGLDPDRACGPAARRGARHHRGGGVGDAHFVGGHRISRDAVSHRARQPACVRRHSYDPGVVRAVRPARPRCRAPHAGMADRRAARARRARP